MNEEQKRREMQIERMQEDLLNCLVFSRNGGVKCRETAENLSIMGYCKPGFPIELLDVDALDKAWLKGFDKGFDEGVSVLKEFAEKLKDYLEDKLIDEFEDMASDVKYLTIDIDEFEQYVDELLKEYEE